MSNTPSIPAELIISLIVHAVFGHAHGFKLRGDGSFTVRLAMPDKRQVLPVVASTPDGVEQRTIVIAVERNTKVLEPMLREIND